MGQIRDAYGSHMWTKFATYGAFSKDGEESPTDNTTYGNN